MLTGPLADYMLSRQGDLSVEIPEVPEVPPPPFAQITLTEMSEGLERIDSADEDLMRALLRVLVYERDGASARILRALRRERTATVERAQ